MSNRECLGESNWSHVYSFVTWLVTWPLYSAIWCHIFSHNFFLEKVVWLVGGEGLLSMGPTSLSFHIAVKGGSGKNLIWVAALAGHSFPMVCYCAWNCWQPWVTIWGQNWSIDLFVFGNFLMGSFSGYLSGLFNVCLYHGKVLPPGHQWIA